MSKHRVYPGRLLKAPRGICAWCGLHIKNADGSINRSETFCGPVCHTHYQLRADPTRMRQFVFFRDHGICAACQRVHLYIDGDWQADHVRPLFRAGGDPSYWNPENVVLLCTDPCHKAKTRADRKRYRGKRRRLREIENS